MTYIELINQFWNLDENWQFTCCETRLYFYLLKTANRLGWVDSWTRIDARVAVDVGVSVNSLKTARNRLSQAGLISYVSGGKGKGNKTKYQLSYQDLTPNLTPKVEPKVQPKVEPKVQPKPAYIGTRIDKDKDIDNISLSPAHTREDGSLFDFRVLEKPINECYKVLLAEQTWIELATMNIRKMGYSEFTIEKLQYYLETFFGELQGRGEETKSPADAKAHFFSWLKVELKNKKNENGEINRHSNTGSKRTRETPNYDEDFHGNA